MPKLIIERSMTFQNLITTINLILDLTKSHKILTSYLALHIFLHSIFLIWLLSQKIHFFWPLKINFFLTSEKCPIWVLEKLLCECDPMSEAIAECLHNSQLGLKQGKESYQTWFTFLVWKMKWKLVSVSKKIDTDFSKDLKAVPQAATTYYCLLIII